VNILQDPRDFFKSNDLADSDLLETELEQLSWRIVEGQIMETITISKIDRFDINLQFELTKAISPRSPCIIWIPNIHDLHVRKWKDFLSLGILANHLSRD
jgi:hypothetical protein